MNVRTGPSQNHVRITQLDDGVNIAATGRQGEYVRFLLPPSVPIWISEGYVEPMGDGNLRVKGNRVRLRAYPSVDHSWIGLVGPGTVLRPTGVVDAKDTEYGPWVQVEAAAGATAWIHQNYVTMGRALAAGQVASFYRGTPGVTRPPTGIAPRTNGSGGTSADVADATPRPSTSRRLPVGDTAAAGTDAGAEAQPLPPFRFPAVGAEPLLAIYEKLRAENAKPPAQWKFDPIIAELRTLSRRTEDQVVADTARDWISIIEEHWVPVQVRMAALERKKEAARRAAEVAEAKEREIEKKPGEKSTPREKKFLAVGWVDVLGKHRKVDGTHRLLKGSRLMFYLKSEQLKLDSYVDKYVGISGVIQEQPPGAGAQLIHVTGIEVLSD